MITNFQETASLHELEYFPSLMMEFEPHIRVAIDAEWVEIIKELARGLCFQVGFDNGFGVMVMNKVVIDITPLGTLYQLRDECIKRGYGLIYREFNDTVSHLHTVMELVDPDGWVNTLDTFMFYSPVDGQLAWGWEFMAEAYKNNVVTQKRNLSGKFKVEGRQYIIKDLKGWALKGFKELMMSVGVETKDKEKMDKYKSNMHEGLIANPGEWLDYCMQDVFKQFETFDKFLESQQWLQREVFELPEDVVFTQDTIPGTTGSVVAQTFESYIHTKLHPDRDLWEFCLKKLGILSSTKQETRCLFNNVIDSVKGFDDYEKLPVETLKKFNNLKLDFEVYSQNSVEWHGRKTNTTGVFNAVVQGARANDERPEIYRCEYTIDPDFASAYASVLCGENYYIGLTRETSFTNNDVRFNVKNWMKKHLSLCGRNAWQLTVDTAGKKLLQDLITSKYTTAKDINKAIICYSDDSEDEDNIQRIPGIFGVFTDEISNGIINERTWKIIKAVATPQEMKEILQLEVVAAVYYYESDKCETPEEWVEKVLADEGRYTTDDNGNVIDTRTRAFFALPINDVIGKVVKKRKVIKTEQYRIGVELKSARQKGLDKIEMDGVMITTRELACMYDKLQAQQECLKLFGNTFYGDMASPYMSISNVLVANNITSAMRIAVWMLAKACNLLNTVTDGGILPVLEVLFLTGKRPGLAALSNMSTLVKHRSIKVGSLGGKNWKEIFDKGYTERKLPFELTKDGGIDKLVEDHVNSFWASYGLKLEFNIEVKYSHASMVTATWSKADYAFRFVESDEKGNTELFKIRGCKNYSDDSSLKKSPKYELLKNILNGSDVFPESLHYDHSYLLKTSKWKLAEGSKGYEHLKDIRPGESVVEEREYRQNNMHMRLSSVTEYKRREKRAASYKGKGIPLFERYAQKGIAYVHKMMLLDKLVLV